MKTYFTQEALDTVKEKISKFQAGNRELHYKHAGKMMLSDYLQRGGVFENSKPIQYSPHDTSVSKEYKTPVFDNMDNFKKTALKVLEAASYPISESFIPIQGAPITIFRQFQRLSPEQLREVFQEFKDNTTHGNTWTNKR